MIRTKFVETLFFFFRKSCTLWDNVKKYCRDGVVAYFGGFKSPPPSKFRRPSKIVPNSTRLWKLLKIAEFRTPTPKDVWKKGSKILKLPPVRNCFTLAKTNKLVVIINSLKVPKIKKILLHEMKFIVRNYNCLQNPWQGGCRPQNPVLCPQINLLNPHPPEQNSWVRHWFSTSLHTLPNQIKGTVLA